MPPADPATLLAAVATVRENFSELSAILDADNFAKKHFPVESAAYILARELIRLLDAGELVRVRGLEWKDYTDREGAFYANDFADVLVVFEGREWRWSVETENGFQNGICGSLDDGKRLAEAEYRSRLAAALEPLFAKEVGR